ncbi:MAG: hypothetical protein WCV41_04655, partial [Patescibacteria group bacterium]
MIKILPTITTTSVRGRDWREQFKEIKELDLKEAAFFPTCLRGRKAREKAYALIENSPIKTIPFVHLRADMDNEEIEYLMKNYGTKIFNIHSKKEHAPQYDLSKYKDIIYVENHPTHYLE